MGVGTIAREREGLVSTASSVGTRIVGTGHIYKHRVSIVIVKPVSFTIDFHIMCLGIHTRESFLIRHQYIRLHYEMQLTNVGKLCS